MLYTQGISTNNSTHYIGNHVKNSIRKGTKLMFARTLRPVSRLYMPMGGRLPARMAAGSVAAGGEVDDAPTTNQKYVRQGAAGSADGSDWTNAYTDLPATLVRDTTYWVADGSYGSYTFNDAVSGSLVIRIKKATGSLHGTDTGWSAGYGDGQAIWGEGAYNNNLVWAFETGHYIVDGSFRGADWFDGAGYGFVIDNVTGGGTYNFSSNRYGDRQIGVGRNGAQCDNVKIGYVYIKAHTDSLPASDARRYAVDTDTFSGNPDHTNLVFHHMYVLGSNNVWFLRTSTGTIVEYCASFGVINNGANHGEIVNCYFSVPNAVIRYNKFAEAYNDGSWGTALVAIQDSNGIEVYGNLCWNFACGDAGIGFDGGNASNCKIYNNTFVDATASNQSGFSASAGTGNIVRNNLWVNCVGPNVSPGGSGTITHNAWSNATGTGTDAQVNVPTSIFTNYASGDFRLASNTTAGANLGAPYNVDMLGNTRTTWSRGAFEYQA